ncbi:hypothetical protein BWK63_04990 [Flavobacterium covae]|uniref:hypothetical protein n=1 Tax=Flavobacterium covae TaxID=2906076 RepID=UPI000B4D2CBA|nr:hypothetical protein [Flavobacterium covae]OWP81642.1 hypothetical protein BWK63_04990 [Flavobacterium covae]
MKHWSEFLPQRTHVTKRLAKMANALTFEVQSKELELQNAKANLERFELQICNKIAGNYQSECEYENAIIGAKHKADKWNNEPIDSHKPHKR